MVVGSTPAEGTASLFNTMADGDAFYIAVGLLLLNLAFQYIPAPHFLKRARPIEKSHPSKEPDLLAPGGCCGTRRDATLLAAVNLRAGLRLEVFGIANRPHFRHIQPFEFHFARDAQELHGGQIS